MNHEEKHSTIKDRLLKDIRAGEVHMTPRAYFTLKLSALIIMALSALAISIFICNFIFFSIRFSGQHELLGFGSRGFTTFLYFFPWHLLAIDILLIALLQRLLRQFRTGYKIPVLYLLGALILAAALLGFAVDSTRINDRMAERSERLPSPFRDFYDRAQRPLPLGSGVCRCTIIAIEGNKLTVEDLRDGTSTLVVFLPENNPRATTTSLQVGDIVFIAGEEADGVIEAFGIRKEPPGGHRPRVMPPRLR